VHRLHRYKLYQVGNNPVNFIDLTDWPIGSSPNLPLGRIKSISPSPSQSAAATRGATLPAAENGSVKNIRILSYEYEYDYQQNCFMNYI
jgi:hypothetical protein